MKCPNCGFDPSAPAATPMKSGMSHYVSVDGKSRVVFNDVADKVKIGGVEHIRADLYEESPTKGMTVTAPVTKPIIAPIPAPVVPVASAATVSAPSPTQVTQSQQQ